MQVTRETPEDGTPVVASTTPPTCTCYFLSKIPGATGTPPNCTPCSTGDASACGTGQTCIRGFCEGTGAGIPSYAGDGGGCDTTTSVGPNACTNAQAVVKTGVIAGDAGF
jgi:hypothetical protein